jgi:hypothetical protein
MSRNFSHPRARSARVWSATTEDGVERRILVIVTTIELDPKHDRYSKELVGKLSRPAEEHLAHSSGPDNDEAGSSQWSREKVAHQNGGNASDRRVSERGLSAEALAPRSIREAGHWPAVPI